MISNEEKINLAKKTALIAGVFTALVSLLMILNYLQIRASDPLESEVLQVLVERLSADPGNQALMDEIRQYDLLARKAYFNSLWQIRTGAWLLVIGAVVLIAALRIWFTLGFTIEKPSHEGMKERQKRIMAQRWLAVAGAVVLGLTVASAFFSADHLKRFDAAQLAVDDPADGIQQVDIVRRVREGAAGAMVRPQRADGQDGDAGRDDDPGADDGQAAGTLADALSIDAETTGADRDAGAATDAAGRAATPGAAAGADLPVISPMLTTASVTMNHNAFRGPWSNGISPRRNIPGNWDGPSGRNIRWKTPIPLHGYNSPVLWEDRLFLSGADATKRVVYCLDRHSGRILWEREANNIAGSPATPPRTTDDTGLAAPTLTTDGQRVFAIFGTGDIIAFDFDGNRLWARNLGVPLNHYGHSSSLVTWDGKVFVQYDTQETARVMALNAATGQTVWETRRTSGISWASPIIMQHNGQYQLVLSAVPNVAAYDIATGRELWSVNCMSGEVGPSPTYGGGMIYAANEYAKLVAINATTGQIVWEDNYYLPEVASPLYHNGLLYIATSYAVFACFDAASGEFLWEFDADDGFYSSPVFADGKIIAFDMGGKAYVFRPGKTPQLVGSPVLGERVYATPVFADGKIYIRGNRHVYCIGDP